MFSQIIALLSWLALPVGLIVIIDDWFIRPRRQIAASPQPPRDPPLMRTAYTLLPLLILAAVLRLLLAERLDFSSVLFGITAITGVVWLVDVAVLRPRRVKAALRQHADRLACSWRVPALAVSSTDLRARAADGRPLDYLVPEAAVRCLRARALYATDR